VSRAALVAAAVAGALVAPATARAAVREFWVAAEPVTHNLVPTGRDHISGRRLGPAETVLPTVVYRRYTRGWKRRLPNLPHQEAGVTGPLLRAVAGDTLRVHFLNRDRLYERPHSMHFHGVRYAPSSDGAYVPGVSGPDAAVAPGRSHTYVLRADEASVGAWPYHDHSPSMMPSIEGGMYGMLSIRGRRERAPDREFVVPFAAMHGLQTIGGRAFVGNTPVFRAKAGELVQFDVMAMGSEHHTFHVHGHRWSTADGTRDTQTVGPAESFRFRWRERDPGTWLYHCHVEDHMMNGMIGLYRVER
jgi:manganese oxidase